VLLSHADSVMLCQPATLSPQATVRWLAEHSPQVMCPEPVNLSYPHGQLLRQPRLLWYSYRKPLS